MNPCKKSQREPPAKQLKLRNIKKSSRDGVFHPPVLLLGELLSITLGVSVIVTAAKLIVTFVK